MKPSTAILFSVGNTNSSFPKLSNSQAHRKEPIIPNRTPHHGRRNFLAAFMLLLMSFIGCNLRIAFARFSLSFRSRRYIGLESHDAFFAVRFLSLVRLSRASFFLRHGQHH